VGGGCRHKPELGGEDPISLRWQEQEQGQEQEQEPGLFQEGRIRIQLATMEVRILLMVISSLPRWPRCNDEDQHQMQQQDLRI